MPKKSTASATLGSMLVKPPFSDQELTCGRISCPVRTIPLPSAHLRNVPEKAPFIRAE